MFRRLHRWLGRFLGFTSSSPAAEEKAEAILAGQKERFVEKIASYDRALAARAALCEVLTGQIKESQSERLRLGKALEAEAAAVKAGPSAGELALRWESSGKELAALQAQLQRAQDERDELAAAREQVIQDARNQWAELKEVLGQDRIARALSEMGGPGGS